MTSSVSNGRPIYRQEDIDHHAKRADATAKKPQWKETMGSCINVLKCKQWLRNRLPVLSWLPTYNFKKDLVTDIMAGITVGIMLIPQSMAYGTLAGLDAAHGLYTSFFPGFLYFLLGTSRHNSLGVFAVISMMVASVRFRLAPYELSTYLATNNSNLVGNVSASMVSPFDVVAAVTFATGLISVALAVCQAGFLSVLMSDQVSAGFTTGAGVHVLSAQLDKMLGLANVGRYSGAGKLFYLYLDIVSGLKNCHWPSIIMSVVSLIFICLIKEVLNPLWMKQFRHGIPIPGDMILIIFGTLLSHFLKLQNYGIEVVGEIPSGIPPPKVPNMSLLLPVLFDALVICIVCYCVSISLAQMAAKRFRYNVDPAQEFFALGTVQVFTSFFGCIPPCAAMGRTMVFISSGGQSQICSLVSSMVVLLVIYWIGPLLEALPQCLLSVIIVVALKGILLQFSELCNLWKTSKADFAVWIVSFAATVVLDIAYGLAAGVCFAFLSFGFKFIGKKLRILGSFANTELYLDKADYKELNDLDGLLIAAWDAPLFYGNVKFFENQVFKMMANAWSGSTTTDMVSNAESLHVKQYVENVPADSSPEQHRCLILDFSKVSAIDTPGIQTLSEVVHRAEGYSAACYLACCSGQIRAVMEKSPLLKKVYKKLKFFPSVHDAVRYSQEGS